MIRKPPQKFIRIFLIYPGTKYPFFLSTEKCLPIIFFWAAFSTRYYHPQKKKYMFKNEELLIDFSTYLFTV
jgi:hypothetical protein